LPTFFGVSNKNSTDILLSFFIFRGYKNDRFLFFKISSGFTLPKGDDSSVNKIDILSTLDWQGKN
jgi:hypothetical protein